MPPQSRSRHSAFSLSLSTSAPFSRQRECICNATLQPVTWPLRAARATVRVTRLLIEHHILNTSHTQCTTQYGRCHSLPHPAAPVKPVLTVIPLVEYFMRRRSTDTLPLVREKERGNNLIRIATHNRFLNKSSRHTQQLLFSQEISQNKKSRREEDTR